MGDERGTPDWDRVLPEGWTWCTPYNAPATYDDHLKCEALKKKHADYFEIEQLHPRKENGRPVFYISKWNFLHKALTLTMPEKERDLWVAGFAQSSGLRFDVDDELVEARADFEKLDAAAATDALKSAAPKLPLAAYGTEAGLMVVRTGKARVVKGFFEVIGSAFLLRWQPVAGAKGAAGDATVRVVLKDLDDPWTLDLDEDGVADIAWSPPEKQKSLMPLAGATLALARTYPLR